jgi:autotransporter-associated beta strand protein
MRNSIQPVATVTCPAPRRKDSTLRKVAVIGLVLLPMLGGSAQAATYTKKSGATLYNNASTWTPSGPPGSGDIAEWNVNTGGAASGGLGASMTWLGLSLTDTVNNQSIGHTTSATLTLGSSGITCSSIATRPLTLNCQLALGSAQAWTVTGGSLSVTRTVANGGFLLTIGGNNNTTIQAVISGTGGLQINRSGSNPVTLSGANTYTGFSTLTAGAVNLGIAENVNSSGPLGKYGGGAWGSIILNGGYLQYSSVNVNDYSGRFDHAANQRYNIDNNGQNVTWATALISSGGTLTKIGAGTLTLSGANTYGGETTVTGGVLLLNNASALPGGSLLTLNGGVLELKATPRTMTRTLGSAAGNVRITGGISGFSTSGGVTDVTIGNSAGSTVTWGGPNFNPTALVLNEATATANNINFNNVLDLGGSASTDNRTINVNTSTAGGTATLAYGVTGTGGLIKGGPGILNVPASCNYNGATAIQNGTLAAYNGNDRLPAGTTLTLGSGTTSGKLIIGTPSTARSQTLAGLLTSGTGTANAVVGQATANSTLTLNIASGNNTFDGILGGAGANENNLALNQTGNGTLTLSGANTYVGGTTISAGALALSGSGSISGSSQISVGAGATFDVSALSSTLTLGDSQTLSGPSATGTATLTAGASIGLAMGSSTTLWLPYFVPGTASFAGTGGALTLAAGNPVRVVIKNGGTALPIGDYQLVSAGSGGSVGGTAPTSVTLNDAGSDGIASGLAASLQITGSELYLHVYNPCTPPSVGAVSPASQAACAGSPATFTVSASGTGPLSYQWRKVGGGNVGTDSSSFTINPVQAGHAGSYECEVTGQCGSPVTATAGALTVKTPPTAPDSGAGIKTTETLVIDVDKLLARATGSGLSVTAVQNPSTMNGGVSLIGSPATGISYTAPSTAGVDSFTYTITDGNGCTVSPTIYVTNSVSGGYSPNYVPGSGHFEGTTWKMQFRGIPDVTYGIEWATSASGPWTRFSPDVTAGSTGLISVSDSSGDASKFYRTVYP